MEEPQHFLVKNSEKTTSVELIGGIKCYICCEIFGKEEEIKNHFQNNHPIEVLKYGCPKCTKLNNTYSGYRSHCYRHALRNKCYRCPLCCNRYKQSRKLAHHILTIHKTANSFLKTIVCPICEAKFNNENDFIKHNHDHTDNKTICNEETGYNINFMNNEEKTEPENCKTFKCSQCPRTFSKADYLKKHLNRMHKTDEKILKEDPNDSKSEPIIEVDEFFIHTLPKHDNDKVFNINNDKLISLEENETQSQNYSTVQINDNNKETPNTQNLIDFNNIDVWNKKDANPDKILIAKTKKINSVELNGGIKCYLCLEVLDKQDNFMNHFKNLHPNHDLKFGCTKCTTTSTKYSAFRSHCYRHVLRINSYRCPFCHIQYRRSESLALHISSVHKSAKGTDKMVTCPICQENFVNKEDFIKHNEDHIKPEVFPCPLCPKIFPEQSFLSRHLPFHFDDKIYKCNDCDKYFKTPKCLSNHSIKHSNKEFKCNICNKTLYNATKLNNHMLINHAGVRPYACQHCSKTFTNYSNVQKHSKRIHKTVWKKNNNVPERSSEILVLKCQYCESIFKNNLALNTHVKIEHPKMYKDRLYCESCEIKFPNIKEKKEHNLTHIREKPYKCNLCSGSYSQSYNLKKHMRYTHSNFVIKKPDEKVSKNEEKVLEIDDFFNLSSTKINDTNSTDTDKMIKMNVESITQAQKVYMVPEGDYITEEINISDLIGLRNSDCNIGKDTVELPEEYGPEFTVNGTIAENCEPDKVLQNMEEAKMPHIDPLLTFVGNDEINFHDPMLKGNFEESSQYYVLSQHQY